LKKKESQGRTGSAQSKNTPPAAKGGWEKWGARIPKRAGSKKKGKVTAGRRRHKQQRGEESEGKKAFTRNCRVIQKEKNRKGQRKPLHRTKKRAGNEVGGHLLAEGGYGFSSKCGETRRPRDAGKKEEAEGGISACGMRQNEGRRGEATLWTWKRRRNPW